MPVGGPRAAVRSGGQDGGGDAIPDSVVSRPNDDDSVPSVTLERGLEILVDGDFGEIGARISNNTSGVTRAYLLDSSENVIDETDISGLSSGDAFTLAGSMTSGKNYIIAVDAEGSNYTIGFRNSEQNYPYTSTDVDITGRYKSDIGVDTGNVHAVNDIGNTGF